jgi:rubrerythrin
MAKVHFFDVSLAVKYGPIEAIILTNICFWLEKNRENRKHYIDGRYWVYNSIKAFENLFPYLNGDQIRRTIEKLRHDKVLYVGKFNRTGYDRTLWYSVNDEVLELYRDKTEGNEYLYKGYTGISGNDQPVNTGDTNDKNISKEAGTGDKNRPESPEIRTETGEIPFGTPLPPENSGEKYPNRANLPDCPNGKIHLANLPNANDQMVNTGDTELLGGSPEEENGQFKPPEPLQEGSNEPENPEKEGEGTVNSLDKAQPGGRGSPNFPNGKLHLANLPNGNDQTVNSIWQKCQIDLANSPDRFGEFAKPIPYINTYNKPAAAFQENTGNKNPAAAKPLLPKISKEMIRDTLRTIDAELIFDTVFYKKAEEYLNQEGLDTGYLGWIYQESLSRKPEKLRGMYYTLIFQKDLTEIYKAIQDETLEFLMICPVCGTEHNKNDYVCPECNFQSGDLLNEDKVKFEKKLYFLDEAVKERYMREVVDISNNFHITEWEDRKSSLKKKYHLLE